MSTVRKIARKLRQFYYSLGSTWSCPICQFSGHSFIAHRRPQQEAISYICPSCGSLARHRFAFLALESTMADNSESILHFAPESCMEKWFRSLTTEYLSVDLAAPNAMKHMDITALALDDNQYSLIWCSHVLEHIVDDHQAMKELYRVLRPGGIAIVLVPVFCDTTYEDFSITSPEERLKHFHQKDHVRNYGYDICERLSSVGFNVQVLSLADFPQDVLSKHSLEYPHTREIFLCTKPVN